MSEAKTIELTINERVAALKVFDAFKGSLVTLSALVEDVKQFPLSDEEWEKAERKIEKNADNTENWTWKDDVVKKEVKLQDETVKYLKEEIKKKSDAGEITLKDISLSTLNNKLA